MGRVKGSRETHKGLLYRNMKIFPNNINIKLIDGIVWASLPNVPGKLFLKPIKSYHFADINLFEYNNSLIISKHQLLYFP